MSERRWSVRWFDCLLLLVGASFRVASVAASNPVDVVHPTRLLGIVGVTWVAAVGGVSIAVRLGVRRTTAVYSVFTALVLSMLGGMAFEEFGLAVGLLGCALFLVTMVIVLIRMESHHLANVLFVGLAVALITGPITIILHRVSNWGDSVVEDVPEVRVTLEVRPNIFLVVVDGYPGFRALQMDMGDLKEPFRLDLLDRGFEVPSSAWTSYWWTRLALPAMFEMGYPVVVPTNDYATQRELYQISSGNNNLVQLLSQAGYETHMIDSGWSGTVCGDEYRFCYPGPFLDVLTFGAFEKSVPWHFMKQRWGHPLTIGALHSMSWAQTYVERISNDGQPSFVFVHVLAPHPPFFLDPACRSLIEAGRRSPYFVSGVATPEEQEGFFVEQTECVDRFILEIADLLQPEDVLIVLADHGTDRRMQADPEVVWSDQAIVERMNVMAAFRLGELDCTLGDPLILPNVFRRLLSCLGEPDLEDVEPRMFINPMVELDRGTVDDLLYGALGSS